MTNADLRISFVIRHSSFVILYCVLTSASISAEAPPLLDRPAFDQIILNEANENATLDVSPLDLPRPLTTLPAEGKLTLQLIQRPTESFDVDWTAVARIRLHEQILLEEAQRLTAAGDFDLAFDYFTRLSRDYPNVAGLNEALSDFLRRNAFALYKAGQNDRALALLLTLYERNSHDPGLPSAVEKVAGEIMKSYLQEQNFAAARAVLDLWRTQFRGVSTDAALAWQRRFEAAAHRKVEEARQLMIQKQFIPARKAAEGALAIWPDLKSATDLLAEIQRDFPFVTVAVFETSPSKPTRRLDDWAAMRTSPLVQRMLAEQVDFGAEGGVYRSPFGTWSTDDSGLILSLKLTPQAGLTADALARYLLKLVTPGHELFRSDLANLLDGVSIADADELRLHLVRPHVRPEALVQFPPPAGEATDNSASAGAASGAGFRIADHIPEQVVFTPVAGGRSTKGDGLQAIIERRMQDDQAAVNALLAGDVDILDRVPPWRVEQLRAAPGIRLQSYRLPTVHVLIPNPNRPLLGKREFRRALCFGLDRKSIVERVLLGGTKLPGYEVLSGPFPTGLSLSDPIRYAYNSQITPRSFEPRLAAILAEVAWANVQAAADKESEARQKNSGNHPDDDKQELNTDDAPLTDMPELVVAHPSDPVARIACQSIELQLEREGIPIKLYEFTSDELQAGRLQCDLRYAELAVWEPVTDAGLIMGPGSLAAIDSPYLNAALRRLDHANNWKDVRTHLADIHQIVHHELPVIPLWQTANYYATRASLGGIGDEPLTLYQYVDQWQLSSSSNVAHAGSAR